jgi:hypothetical protein
MPPLSVPRPVGSRFPLTLQLKAALRNSYFSDLLPVSRFSAIPKCSCSVAGR